MRRARVELGGPEGGRGRRPLERRVSSVSRGTDAERRNPRLVRDCSADLPHVPDTSRAEVTRAVDRADAPGCSPARRDRSAWPQALMPPAPSGETISCGPSRVPAVSGIGSEPSSCSLAPGPHPRRELTPMPRLGFARPRVGMAAGSSILHRRGPDAAREAPLQLLPDPRSVRQVLASPCISAWVHSHISRRGPNLSTWRRAAGGDGLWSGASRASAGEPTRSAEIRGAPAAMPSRSHGTLR